MVACALEEFVDEIDKELVSRQCKWIQHLSYERSSSAARVRVTHYNEMINVKSSFELTHNADLEDEAKHTGKSMTLQDLLIEQEDNGDKLFIAIDKDLDLQKKMPK